MKKMTKRWSYIRTFGDIWNTTIQKIVTSYFVFISPKTRQEDERSGEEEWKNVQVVRIYNNKEGSRKQKMLILRQSHTRKNNKPDFPPVPNSSLNPTHCPTFFLCSTWSSFENDRIKGITQNARNYPILGKPEVLVIPRCDWVFAIFSDFNIWLRGYPIYPEIPNLPPQKTRANEVPGNTWSYISTHYPIQT